MSLEDILSELKAERPAPSASWEPGHAPWGILNRDHKWSAADKEASMTLNLSRYEAYWLWCRLEVHLRSYEAVEWSEMKEVLQCVLKKIETISTPISEAIIMETLTGSSEAEATQVKL